MAAPSPPPNRGQLLVTFDAHECHPSEAEYDKMRDGLGGLANQVENFPQHDLRVVIEHKARTNEYVVKLTLLLDGRTLVCGDHDPILHAAFERAVDCLVDEVKEYKDSLGRVPERQKVEERTHAVLMPAGPLDAAALDAAAKAGDYPAFRSAIAPYEEELRTRAGRWVERYPEVQARMGHGLETIDVVESVFLAAFEQHENRPPDVRYGAWLEGLLDPAVRAFAAHPDEELENVNMARTACAAAR